MTFGKLMDNNHGIVFVTVLIIVLVAMVLAVSALSLNISQVKSAEDEVRAIQSGLIGDGAVARVHINQFSATPSNQMTSSENLGNTAFQVRTNIVAGGTGPSGSASSPLQITVTYP